MATLPPRGTGDSYNPYASPSATLRPSEDEFGYPMLGFGVSEVIGRSWAIYQSRMGFCIGVVVGLYATYFASVFVLGFAIQLVAATMNDANVMLLANFGLTVANALLSIWLTIGMTIIMLKVARGRLASFGELFSGGPYIVATFLSGLLLGLAVMGAVLVVMIPAGLVAAMVSDPATRTLLAFGGIVIGVCFLVGLAVRVSQVSYAIVDQGVGPIEAIRFSMQATAGKTGTLVLIFLMTGLINIAGALALLVGLVFTVPFTFLILAVTYTALVDKPGRSTGGVTPGWRKPEPLDDF